MSKHSGEKEKRENLFFQQIPRPRFTLSRAYESCLACQRLITKKVSKSGLFQAQMEAIQAINSIPLKQ